MNHSFLIVKTSSVEASFSVSAAAFFENRISSSWAKTVPVKTKKERVKITNENKKGNFFFMFNIFKFLF